MAEKAIVAGDFFPLRHAAATETIGRPAFPVKGSFEQICAISAKNRLRVGA